MFIATEVKFALEQPSGAMSYLRARAVRSCMCYGTCKLTH